MTKKASRARLERRFDIEPVVSLAGGYLWEFLECAGKPIKEQERMRQKAELHVRKQQWVNLHVIAREYGIQPHIDGPTGWLLAWCLAEEFVADFATYGVARTESGSIRWTLAKQELLIRHVEFKAVCQNGNIKAACKELEGQKNGPWKGLKRLEATYYEAKKQQNALGKLPWAELKRVCKKFRIKSPRLKSSDGWILAFALSEYYISDFSYREPLADRQAKRRGPQFFWTDIRMIRLLVLFQLGIREGMSLREVEKLAFECDATFKGRGSLLKRFYQFREHAEALSQSIENDEIALLLCQAAKK